MNKSNQTIVIKRVKKAAHGHHGGAWKIAYADFVTAMMAFFLLMWLISMTTKEQKIGMANYFSPPNVSPTTAGSGGILMGTTIDKTGAKASDSRDTPWSSGRASNSEVSRPAASDRDRRPDDGAGKVSRPSTGDREGPPDGGGAEASRPSDSGEANRTAAASLRQALQSMPDFAELSRNILVEETKDGVNVSFMDQDGRSMFPEDSVQPHDRVRRVLEGLVPTLRRLPNRMSVAGHTAATRPGSGRSVDAWSLTTGRAIAVREILSGAGVPGDRFVSVEGRADTDPAFPENPSLAPNQRVTITLTNEASPLPPDVFR